MITPFSQLLHSAQQDGEFLTLQVPEDWMQGRSVFGGLQVALALKAMRSLVPNIMLRTVQAIFIAPSSTTLRVKTDVLRRGKSTVHVQAQLVDGDAVVALVVAVFGVARPSAVAVMPMQEPIAASHATELPFLPGITPSFIQHFRVFWKQGLPPFTGDTALKHVVEIDLRDSGKASYEHLVAFADFIPPLGLSHLTSPAPASTLTWMLEILHERVDALPLQGWRVDAELLAAHGGYTSQSVMLWGPGGVPVAVSRQSMLIFETIP